MGEDVSDGKEAALKKLGKYYASKGVTSWCPTTMTLPEDQLTNALRAVNSYIRPKNGAKILGVNLEGPFLSYEKRGAQCADYLIKPDIGLFDRLNSVCQNKIRLITVAPEINGSLEFIKSASSKCCVSIGHTGADYHTAFQGFQAGATHVTHMFNGMPPIHHRDPGVIGAAFDCKAFVELICDGIHVNPTVVRMANTIFQGKLILISDSIRCAAMDDGEYTLGGQNVTLKDGKATLSGSNTFAGSTIHLMDGLKNAVSFGISLEDAVHSTTAAPAKSIGADHEVGSLEPGHWADIVVLDKKLNVQHIFINGVEVCH